MSAQKRKAEAAQEDATPAVTAAPIAKKPRAKKAQRQYSEGDRHELLLKTTESIIKVRVQTLRAGDHAALSGNCLPGGATTTSSTVLSPASK